MESFHIHAVPQNRLLRRVIKPNQMKEKSFSQLSAIYTLSLTWQHM